MKVTIISGFLGAGKTTLIQKLLKESLNGQKVVLLENEYGEVGIDGGFMKDAGIQVTELNSGCICCTLAGDFEEAIHEIVTRFAPERLLIEPSGVGKLSDIRRVVEETASELPGVTLEGSATVVDANKCRMYLKNFGEFFIDQIKCAETVILSRSQMVTPEKREAAVELIRAQNPNARIITTPWDALTGDIILSTIENPEQLIDVNDVCPVCGCHHDHEHEHHCHHDHDEHEHHCHHDDEHEHHCHHDDEHEHHCHHDDDEHEHHCHHDDEHEHHCHHDHDEHEHHCHHDHDDHEHHCHHHHAHDHHGADDVFDTIGVETAKTFEVSALKAMLSKLSDEATYGTVLRAKGILPATDGTWIHFDYVPEETDIRTGSADYTGRLCVIGVGLQADALHALFGV